MIDFDIILRGGKQGFKSALVSARNAKVSSSPIWREKGFVKPLIDGYKCTPEEAEFVKQQMYAIVDWMDAHPKQDPPQELFNGLHDAGYISDLDYAKLESNSSFIPRCPVCGSPDLKNIGTGTRMVHQGFFGLAGSKSLAQRQCKNCGYKF